MTESFQPLTLQLAKELVGKGLPALLHQWQRLYHHAAYIQDHESAAFLEACIRDLEGIQARTYREPSPQG